MHNIAPKDAFEKLSSDSGALIIDVRTEQEWLGGVPDVKNLKLISISNDFEKFKEQLQEELLIKNNDIFFICRSGARSAMASELAEQIGYKNCYNIAGGFIEWIKSNLPFRDWDKFK